MHHQVRTIGVDHVVAASPDVHTRRAEKLRQHLCIPANVPDENRVEAVHPLEGGRNGAVGPVAADHGRIRVCHDQPRGQHFPRRVPGPAPHDILHLRVASAAAVAGGYRKLNTGQRLGPCDIGPGWSQVARRVLPDGRRTLVLKPCANRRDLIVRQVESIDEDIDLGGRQHPADEIAQIIVANAGAGLSDRIAQQGAGIHHEIPVAVLIDHRPFVGNDRNLGTVNSGLGVDLVVER